MRSTDGEVGVVSFESMSIVARPVRPNAVVWYKEGSVIWHHLRISREAVSTNSAAAAVSERKTRTLWLEVLQLLIQEFKMRLCEVHIRQAVSTRGSRGIAGLDIVLFQGHCGPISRATAIKGEEWADENAQLNSTKSKAVF